MMSMNSKQPHFGMHPTLPEHKYTSLHSSSEAIRRACLQTPQLQSNIFASLDETLLARAEALAAVDIAVSQGKTITFKPDVSYHTLNSVPCSSASTVPLAHHYHSHHHHHQNVEPSDLMDHITSPSLALMTSGHDVAGSGGGGGAGGLISTSAHLTRDLGIPNHCRNPVATRIRGGVWQTAITLGLGGKDPGATQAAEE
ncbi:hypothetical protein COCON_G00046950 [Conger conger]|uniref:Uncharacterized protein n=1 Tax=Conger conger TaxID=82655 RepID=A0A9Q1DUW6_CONCO|nr:hypothetical protein COCON_G00046950 [Conger conger]